MNDIRYPFSNHIIFAMVMENPDLCKELIERILPDRKVREIHLVTSEATVSVEPSSKSVRMDVLFEDGNAWYDIELQVGREPYLPLRARYYASALDVKMMEPGISYRDLKSSYVIFFCCFDYFKKDEPIYHFQWYDRNLHLPLDAKTSIIMVNTKCSEEKVPEQLQILFRYIEHGADGNLGKDPLVDKIDAMVQRLQKSREVEAIMTMEEYYAREIAGAREDGWDDGLPGPAAAGG